MKRVTALIGAGVPLDIADKVSTFPSTKNITDEIVNLDVRTSSWETKPNQPITLLKSIFNRLHKIYHAAYRKWGDPNFEEIIYVLDMLRSCNHYWSNPNFINKEMFMPFTSFVKFYKSHTWDDSDIRKVYDAVLIKLVQIIKEYNDFFLKHKNLYKWYHDFWKNVEYRWDVFNLNYDTTIEQSLGRYVDGYVKTEEQYRRFLPSKLLSARTSHTMNHIHGCILYHSAFGQHENTMIFDTLGDDSVKYSTADIVLNHMKGSSVSDGHAQNGESIHYAPIISGLDKLEKTDVFPFNIYRYNLYSKLLRQSSLLIAGYSFGDEYINKMLYRFSSLHGDKTRVVIIDKWDLDDYVRNYDDDCCISKYSPYLLENYLEERGNRSMNMMILYTARVDYVGNLGGNMKRLMVSKPIYSINGRLMICYNGFKDAVENHEEEIKDFLSNV